MAGAKHGGARSNNLNYDVIQINYVEIYINYVVIQINYVESLSLVPGSHLFIPHLPNIYPAPPEYLSPWVKEL